MSTAKALQHALVLMLLPPLSATNVSRASNATPRVGGPPVNGLQVTLSVQPRPATSRTPDFRLEFCNVGSDDLILKLGMMLANGRKQFPTAVVLNIADSDGVRRRFDLIGPPGVAGRIDPFVLALPVGATFSIPLDLSKYWPSASKEYDYRFKPGNYWIAAEFMGKSVSEREANLDSKNVSLFPYWEGTATSNELRFKIPAK